LTATPVWATEDTRNQIEITNSTYAPTQLRVSKGTTVTWVNDSSEPHTVVLNGVGQTFRSDPIDVGKSYEFTFSKPGIYKYFSEANRQMSGTVIVIMY